jgi:hypothetical protein
VVALSRECRRLRIGCDYQMAVSSGLDISPRGFNARFPPTTPRGLALAAVTALGVATATATAPSAGASTARAGLRTATARITSAVEPGRTGATITLAHNVSFDGDSRSYQMATDESGATYIAWISSTDNDSGGARAIRLCVIPSGARACAGGGPKTLDPTESSTADGLQLVVTPTGEVTILWIANAEGEGSQIHYTTATKTGALSGEATVATPLPVNAALYDAVPAPNGSIWLLASPSDSALQVREGLTGAPINVPLPHAWGFGAGVSSLAFSGSTPIIVAGKYGGGPWTLTPTHMRRVRPGRRSRTYPTRRRTARLGWSTPRQGSG